ncbi:MAG: hypothetical protein ABI969_12515 [bacterium]
MRALLCGFLCATPLVSALGQTPITFQPLRSPSTLTAHVRAAIEQKAGSYQFEGYRVFAKDSALLVFVDSSLTAAALDSNTWMFGPLVSVAEADSCPPEKVLARKIARIFWRSRGRPAKLQYMIVAVRGTTGRDRWTAKSMYFQNFQLSRAWAGDPGSR